MMHKIAWPEKPDSQYRVVIKDETGRTAFLSDALYTPSCILPDHITREKPYTAKIQAADIQNNGNPAYITWVPSHNLWPLQASAIQIKAPANGGDFPLRLRIRTMQGDHVLLDTTSYASVFYLPSDLASWGTAVRYLFLNFDHGTQEWKPLGDYKKIIFGVQPPQEILDTPTVFDLKTCTVCGAELNAVAENVNCHVCESRPRLRSLKPVVEAWLAPCAKNNPALNLPLLAFSMTAGERKMLEPIFEQFKSVSLYGTYGSDHESGIDMRDLSRYASNSFSGCYGCLLFDYFEEHEQALSECFRVIAPGGIFLHHIAAYRLKDSDAPPVLTGMIKKHGDYFNYLPDEAKLPSISVGRKWFIQALKRAGFQAHVIQVRDAVKDTVSDWFVGIKPTLPVNNTHMATAETVFETVDDKNGLKIAFQYLSIEKPESLRFIEDCTEGPVRQILATNLDRNKIYISCDNGESWVEKYYGITWDGEIRTCKTLRSGGRLFWTSAGTLYHFDAAERLTIRTAGKWPWHGSQGIGESENGTIMYGEYAPLRDGDGVVTLNVWRLRPAEDEWTPVMTLECSVRPPDGQIRHFHVCRPNPAKPGQWILTSGDIKTHNRVWLSEDDGDSWNEIKVEASIAPEIAHDLRHNILRLTQFAVMENGDLIWGTDDLLGVGRAALVRLSLASGEPEFRLIGWLGKNCIRNIIPCGQDTFILLSESKHDLATVDCFAYRAGGSLTHIPLPNVNNQSCPVTESLGPSFLRDGHAFLPANGNAVTAKKQGILRLDVENIPDSKARASGLQSLDLEGRRFQYRFTPAKKENAPLLVILHGHKFNAVTSSYKNDNWNVLCPLDNFGLKGGGTWFLGEQGDFFWLRAMPRLIRQVYSETDVYFMGSSMGGYAAILHGIENKAPGVYANVPQTHLLGSRYSSDGMEVYFSHIFGSSPDTRYNNLINMLSPDVRTTFFIAGNRYDAPGYFEEQYTPFIDAMVTYGIPFYLEIRPHKGHALTHTMAEAVALMEKYLPIHAGKP